MTYVPRLVDAVLAERLAAFPAVLLLGPRACGKTTTARRVAAASVSLDVGPQAVPFRADADAALAALVRRADGHGPVLLDEWQEVPETMGAVKRAVDLGAGPGSFVLTGSVRASPDAVSWPGTGRSSGGPCLPGPGG